MRIDAAPNALADFVNHDPQPLALHAANHPNVVLDLTNIEIAPVEIVFQSPPCTHFARTTSDLSTEEGAGDVR